MTTLANNPALDITGDRYHRNDAPAKLIEVAVECGEGKLAQNGTLVVSTGDRTGRSPKDKYLEDTPEVHDKIWWGAINQPITPEKFDRLEQIANEYYEGLEDVFVFDGYVGADPNYRLNVRALTQYAWHALFAQTLFITPTEEELKTFENDWTIINCANRKITAEESAELGINHTGVCVAQSLTRKKVLIFGTEYAGEMKKSLFFAMNYDMPDQGVFPMHCSANVATADHKNVALIFGLSGTGKTPLSADPTRDLIGDDEHGWSDTGVFNFEGGCYAKCIKLRRETEPQIWDAIKFGSVLENVIMDDDTREIDYDDSTITENTRVTYPVEFIPHAVIPSVGNHPKNVIFLTADAFGVLPPVSKLTPEQAMYYFINGYTSKLAGTEAGITEPVPNFSPCFGGAFIPREPMVYAKQLREKIEKHNAHVWLLNTGWAGGPYGVGKRFALPYTRAMVSAILDGSLAHVHESEIPVFGLMVPDHIPGGLVPARVLHPRNTWADPAAYDAKAAELAKRFRENDAKFDMDDAVRAAGPKG